MQINSLFTTILKTGLEEKQLIGKRLSQKAEERGLDIDKLTMHVSKLVK